MRISDWSSDVCSSDLIGATSVVIDQIASATPFFASGNSDSSRACEPGIIGPDTAPCSTRNAISDGRLQATPHRNDANVNSSTEITNTRTTPKRCISTPVNGTDMPLATPTNVNTPETGKTAERE